MTEPPAVRHECAVADRMESAALLVGGIHPRPHSLKDEQVVLLHMVDDAAFNVGDALGNEWGLDCLGFRRSQPELAEFVGVRPRAHSDSHH